MGTPEFALTSLQYLIDSQYNVVAIVTVPDKPAGRGLKIIESPIKKYAKENNIECLQPEKLKADDFVQTLTNLSADLFVVVAFRMLPETVWSIPKYGTINLHASLLPQYRGAAPINHAIINGEKITGVTTFFINKEIDKGNIIDFEKIEITETDDAETLHDKLAITGAALLLKTIDNIRNGNITELKQDNIITKDLKIAPKIHKTDCAIDFNKDINVVYNFIRGLSPYPGAYSNIYRENKEPLFIKIYKTKINNNYSGECIPGNIISDNKSFLYISSKNGWLEILELQIASKKKMNIKEFFNGNKIDENSYCFNLEI